MTLDQMIEAIHNTALPMDHRWRIEYALKAGQAMREYFLDSHDEDCPQAVWDWDAACETEHSPLVEEARQLTAEMKQFQKKSIT